MTKFYVLAGNHAQFLHYQKDSGMPDAIEISSKWSLAGLEPFNVAKRTFWDTLFGRPILITPALQIIPYGTWRDRSDLPEIKDRLLALGISL